MPNRYNRRAAVIRQELLEQLGGECWVCGTTEKLEIDHTFGRDYVPNRVNQLTRYRLVRRAIQENPLSIRLLCSSHNLQVRRHDGTRFIPTKQPF